MLEFREPLCPFRSRNFRSLTAGKEGLLRKTGPAAVSFCCCLSLSWRIISRHRFDFTVCADRNTSENIKNQIDFSANIYCDFPAGETSLAVLNYCRLPRVRAPEPGKRKGRRRMRERPGGPGSGAGEGAAAVPGSARSGSCSCRGPATFAFAGCGGGKAGRLS